MFWLGLLLTVCYVPGYTGASIPTQWVVLSAFLPLALWSGSITLGHKVLLVFAAYALLSLQWTLNPYTWVWGMWVVAIWLLSYHFGTTRSDLRPLWKGMAVGLSVSAAVALAQALDFNPVAVSDLNRPAGLFFNSTLLGVICGLVLVALASHRLWWYTPPATLALILSGSRGGIAILACGLMARFGGWLAGLSVAVAGLAYFAFTTDPSDAQRLQIWGVTLGTISPLGYGAGSFIDLFYVRQTGLTLIRPEYVHNDILQIVYEFGYSAIAIAIVFGMALSKPAHPEFPTAFAFAILAGFYFPFYTPVTAFIGFVVAGSMLRDWDRLWRPSLDWRPRFLSRLSNPEPGIDRARREAVPVLLSPPQSEIAK